MRFALAIAWATVLPSCHLVSGLSEFDLGSGGGAQGGGDAQGGSGGAAQGGGGAQGGNGGGVGGDGLAGGELIWATSFASDDHEIGRALTTTTTGAVVVAGTFYGELLLDMPGQLLSSTGGSQDAALLRLDGGSGAVAASPTSVGGNGSELPQAVAVGPDGATYLCGSYQDTFSFAATTTPDPGSGIDAGFVVAWGPNGAERWVRTFNSPGMQHARCHGVVADGTGVYVTGYFTDAMNWGGTAQTATGKSGFVAKLSAEGDALDVAVLDASGGAVDVHGLALSSTGPVICGELEGTVGGDFDLTFVSGGRDMFVVQLDGGLMPVWQRVIGGPGDQTGEWVATNASGEVVAGAIYVGSLPVLGEPNTGVGGQEAAVVAFDAQGEPRWSRTFVGSGQDRMRSVHLDDAGETFVALGFEQSLSFDGRTVDADETDVLIARLSSDGELVWHVQLGGPGFDMPWGIAERDGVVVVTGEYREPFTVGDVPLKGGVGSNWWVAALER